MAIELVGLILMNSLIGTSIAVFIFTRIYNRRAALEEKAKARLKRELTPGQWQYLLDSGHITTEDGWVIGIGGIYGPKEYWCVAPFNLMDKYGTLLSMYLNFTRNRKYAARQANRRRQA